MARMEEDDTNLEHRGPDEPAVVKARGVNGPVDVEAMGPDFRAQRAAVKGTGPDAHARQVGVKGTGPDGRVRRPEGKFISLKCLTLTKCATLLVCICFDRLEILDSSPSSNAHV